MISALDDRAQRAVGPLASTKGHTTNYPRNCWWVAAFCDEIGRVPVERWLLDRSLLVYRTLDGKAVALDNRCPHRWAPLSAGTIDGDTVRCRYHGFEFGPDGRCVKIPTQATVPASCRVGTYPVIEAQPFIWVWMGDPDRIGDYDAPADTSWYENPNLPVFSGVTEWNANYMMLHENVLDLSHFGFLHAETFGIFDIVEPPETLVTETTVTARMEKPERLLAPLYAFQAGVSPGRPVHFVSDAMFLSPALHYAEEVITVPDPQPGENPRTVIRVLHATTPMSMDRMRYFFVASFDAGRSEPVERGRQDAGPVPPAFLEDQEMIESIYAMLKRDTRGSDYPEFSVRADAAAVQARRKVAALMAREG